MADATDKKEGTTDNSNPSDETTDEGTEEKSANANLTSPEGILMLCIAGLLDGIGFIIFILGTWFRNISIFRRGFAHMDMVCL